MNKGWPSSQKLGNQKYGTLQPLGAGKHGTDVLPKAMSAVTLTDLIPEATSGINYIDLAGHSVLVDDMIRFTGGPLDRQEVSVVAVTATRITLAHKFPAAITVADVFVNMRSVTLTIAKDGSLATSSGPLQFVKDGSVQQVVEDTGTPANNIPLPVKLSGVTGDVNITAGDLNVQLSHVGANADSTRIGDGTTELGIIPVTKEAKVSDAVAITALGSLLTELQLKADLTETQPVSIASSPLPTGAATETTLAAVLAKILAAPATEAKQDVSITAEQAILAKMLVAPSSEAKQDTAITALGNILAKIIAAPATEAKQDTIITALGLLAPKLSEILIGYFNAGLSVPNGSRTAALIAVPASKIGTELEIICKAGDTFSAYDASTGGNFIGRFTNGGGKVNINLVATTSIFLEADTATFTATDIVVNLTGVDA